ncbi:MAG: YidC/Oxa1 family membrane protein insertase [Patescibacteria group bacterium]
MLQALFFNPFYNALIFLAAVLPGNDVGFAIILLTLAVKGILAPLSHSSLLAQRKMRELEPKLKELKSKHKDQNEQALKMMELYREHGVNPFSSLMVMLVQIPIIFGLYFVFQAGIDLASPALYAFTPRPESINTVFLGLVNLAEPSWVLAGIAAITQFFQTQLAVPPVPKAKDGEESTFQEEFARSMSFQARFILPIFIFFISFKLQAALPLYWATSNLFGIAHELYIRREAQKISHS